jgi:signal transduction histidine kinase
MSIRFRLIAGFVAVVVLLGALGYLSVLRSEKALRDAIGHSSARLAQELLDEIDRYLQGRIEDFQARCADSVLLAESLRESNQRFGTMADRDDHIRKVDQAWIAAPKGTLTPPMQAILDHPLSRQFRTRIQFYQSRHAHRLLGELFATNRYGANVAMSGVTTDYRQDDEEWWQLAARDGVYVQDVRYDESAATYAVEIDLRVDDPQGEMLGVIKLVLNIDQALEIVRDMNRRVAGDNDRSATYTLTNRRGEVICSTRDYPRFANLSSRLASAGGPQPGRPRIQVLCDENGEDVLSVQARSQGYRDFDGFGWALLVERPTSEAFAPAYRLRNQMMLWTLGGLVLAALVGWRASASIVRPLSRLSSGARKIGSGNLAHRVGTERNDEVGELSRAFDQMVAGLEQRTLELEAAHRKLVEREKLAVLGQLAGGVGHELRNPLSAIKNGAYFLNMAVKSSEPNVVETLELIDHEVMNCERIISSLLDFARPRKPDCAPVQIGDVLDGAVKHINIPDNVTIVWTLPDTLPSVPGDAGQLGQVFDNLILNAVQAMPDGGELTLTARVAEPGWMEVAVTDSGVGITPEQQAKLFQPLFSTKAKGMGLGLAVIQTLVRQHGGDVVFESEPGRGSTFTVRLPLSREDPS